ncbi:MAG TPA: hypothetical protein VMG12_23325, partial [Polyangiaceae bacterium]|nr:hypothetical protein [Polyangiaceae bacterium]
MGEHRANTRRTLRLDIDVVFRRWAGVTRSVSSRYRAAFETLLRPSRHPRFMNGTGRSVPFGADIAR